MRQAVFSGITNPHHSAFVQHRATGTCTGTRGKHKKGADPSWEGRVWELSKLALSFKVLQHEMTASACCRHCYLEITWIKSCLLNKVQSFKPWASFHVAALQSSEHQAIPLAPTQSGHCQKEKDLPSLWSSELFLGALELYKARILQPCSESFHRTLA